MFNPFGGATDFYPGLIVWCDPACYEADTAAGSPPSKLGPHDYRKSRDLRPCLVISVNYDNQTFQGARLSATTPDDPSQWVKIDSPPPITWKLNGAFIWVGRPPTIAMVFDNPRVMHPNKDTYYNSHPVATSNLQNYWVHRNAYRQSQQMQMHMHRRAGPASSASIRHSPKSIYQTHSNNNSYEPLTAPSPPPKYQQPAPLYAASPFPATAYFQAPQNHYQQNATTFTFNSRPAPAVAVVPPGFIETPQSGWWFNPATGWFWHASRGLVPPSPQR